MSIIILYTVKLALDKLNAIELVQRARLHVTSMSGNINFTTPIPTLPLITAAADALEAADVAVQQNGGKLDRQARNERKAELYQLLKDLGGYVTAVCGGDGEKITSSGFPTRALPSPPVLLPAPLNVRAGQTTMLGQIKVRWGGVKNRKSYVVYWCEGDPLVEANWKMLQIVTTNFHLVTGLDRSKTYFFRITAVGRAGSGPASDVAMAQPM